MTDRSTPNTAHTPPSQPPQGDGADTLVQLYRQANAQDSSAIGPSATSSERILAYAQQQAAQRAADVAQGAATPADLPAAPSLQTSFNGEPANDRRWLRHALGSLAAIGLVGLLTLHHLDEPGAPQLDSPANAPAQQAPAPAAEPAQAAASADAAPPASAANTAANTNKSEEKLVLAQSGSAPAAIKSEAKKEAEHRPSAKVAQDQSAAQRRAPASAEAPAPLTAPTPASSALPAPPAAPVARASRAAEVASAVAPAAASADMAASAAAPASANSQSGGSHRSRKDERAELAPLQATAKPAAKAQAGQPQPLPYCDSSMEAAAQAEQARRIQAREAAKAAGKPLPEPAPLCKPRPRTPATPDAPLDSR